MPEFDYCTHMHYPGKSNTDRLSWLFLDMNAFFASCEQHLKPELRGKPVAVVPTMTDRTCCIAVSYEARPLGIRTGTNVGEARRLARGAGQQMHFVEGRHEDYIRIHHEILKAVETVLPIEKVCSIDEMSCRLDPRDQSPERAHKVARRVKQAIYQQVGPSLRCSVGLATNPFLAKVGSNLEKPNGLSMILRTQLPQRLWPLKLTDLPGIGRNMERRLAARGVRSVRQLTSLSRRDMHEMWHSVLGEQWYHQLRGDEVIAKETQTRTLGHSHVLPPALRTDEGARSVLVRLLHKAAARLRGIDYVACRMVISLKYTGDWPRWTVKLPLSRCSDTPTMLKAFEAAWQQRPPGGVPLQAAITLLNLEPARWTPLPLFKEDRSAIEAARTMDKVNKAIGPNALYFASMHETREAAPLRIAFTRIPDIDSELGGKGARRV